MEDILSQAQSVLSTTTARWTNLAETVPAGLLERKPRQDQWSAVECLQHMVDTEHVFQTRVRALLDGHDFPGFDPDTQGKQTEGARPAAELAQEFARLRAASLAALAHLKPEDLGRRARHQELGPVTMEELLNEWAAHDLNHTVQAERALMQPFIEGSGPWGPYFADHLVR